MGWPHIYIRNHLVIRNRIATGISERKSLTSQAHVPIARQLKADSEIIQSTLHDILPSVS